MERWAGAALPLGYDERRYPIPQMKVLGGNKLNFMMRVRGTDADHGAWERATGGDRRWGVESMRGAEREYEERIAFGSKARERMALAPTV